VSHDLKTPLAKIQLYADTLQSGHATSREKFEAYLGVIIAQSKRLSHLIQELMDFGRIEAGVRQYAMDVLDLREVLRTTLDNFDTELTREGVTTEIELPPQPVRILGSDEGLQQLFDNLISNALKYSPEERYLRVALSTTDGHALVEVTDHGIGVPPRERRRIFQKFYRGDAVASVATGSGIGLAIVAHVARAHGGNVTVSSNGARGSTFTVKLPLVDENAEVWGETGAGD
jgi:signal transduction histidine kinase